MKLLDFVNAIVEDLKANATFLKDVGTHGKIFGTDELRSLSLLTPAVRISMVGSRGGSVALPRGTAAMARANNGMFRGPIQMIAFLIESDDAAGMEARDRAINLADEFMTFIEHRQWGLGPMVGPALITGFEVLYSLEVEDQGVAIAAVSWEQEVVFGRDIHKEDLDLAVLMGGEFTQPDETVLYPERELLEVGAKSVSFKGRSDGGADSADRGVIAEED